MENEKDPNAMEFYRNGNPKLECVMMMMMMLTIEHKVRKFLISFVSLQQQIFISDPIKQL